MSGDELGECVCKLNLILGGGYRTTICGGAPVGEEYREGMDVCGVYSRDVWVGYDDVGKVSKGLEAVGEANGEEGESKIGGGEEGLGL